MFIQQKMRSIPRLICYSPVRISCSGKRNISVGSCGSIDRRTHGKECFTGLQGGRAKRTAYGSVGENSFSPRKEYTLRGDDGYQHYLDFYGKNERSAVSAQSSFPKTIYSMEADEEAGDLCAGTSSRVAEEVKGRK